MEVVELRHRHLRDVAGLCARAFDDYPVTAAMFPGSSRRRARVTRRIYGGVVADCATHGKAHVALRGDDVLGVAAWLPPGGYPLSLRRQLRLVPGALAFLSSYPHRLVRGIEGNRRADRRRPRQLHWYLAVVAVDPAYQGQGVGAAVVRPGLSHVDAARQPCFLETARDRNAAWYTRLGFKTQSIEPLFPGGPPQWYMWRPARVRA